MVSLAARGGMIASMSEPRIDLHGHAGRCFLAGLPAGHQLVATMGAAAVGDAVRAAQAAGMTAVNLSAVSDFAVLRSDPGKGLRAHRDFRPGEAYADYRRQLDGIRAGAAEAGAQVATSADDLERAARDGRTAVLLGCEGGDFLEGDLGRLAEARAAGVTLLTLVHYRVNELGDVQTEAPVHGGLSRFGRDVVAECNRLGIVIDCAHATFGTTMAVLEDSSQPVIISHGQLGHADAGHADAGHPDADHPRLMTADHAAAVAEAGGLIGAWPCGFTSRSFADFGTEILRLTEAASPDRVAIGTDLDGNYRPVLTSYDQLADLAGLLRDRGLPAADVGQILGGNAMNLLTRILLQEVQAGQGDGLGCLDGQQVVVEGGAAGAGVDADLAEAAVPDHRAGPEPAGAAHRDAAAHAGQVRARVHRRLGHEHDRELGRGGPARTELRAEHERLGDVDRRVRVAGRAPGRARPPSAPAWAWPRTRPGPTARCRPACPPRPSRPRAPARAPPPG